MWQKLRLICSPRFRCSALPLALRVARVVRRCAPPVLFAGLLRVPALRLRVGDDRTHFAFLKLRDLLSAKVSSIPTAFEPELLRRFFRERLAQRADRSQHPFTKACVVVSGVTRSPFHAHDDTAFRSLTGSGLQVMSVAPSLVRPTFLSG